MKIKMAETDPKQKMLQKMILQEKARTVKEKYFYRRLGGWWYVIPSLMVLAFIIYIILIYTVSKDLVNGVALAVFFAGMMPIIPIMDYNDKWDMRLEAKSKLISSNPLSNFWQHSYEDGYNYTDSLLEKQIYFVAKIASYLLGVVGFGILSLLAFSWLGSITIAPTTIIIILLVIIIYKQEK